MLVALAHPSRQYVPAAPRIGSTATMPGSRRFPPPATLVVARILFGSRALE